MDTEPPHLVCVEGNIGAGKSTLLDSLKYRYSNDPSVVFIDEPADEWETKGFLELAYNEQGVRPAFQHMVLLSLAGALMQALARRPKPRVVITERSPWGNYHVFAKANLSGNDLVIYKHAWEELIAKIKATFKVKPRFLWLTAAKMISHQQRIELRDRPSERGISKSYLETLEQLHEKWLCHGENDKDAVAIATDAQRPLEVLRDAEIALREWDLTPVGGYKEFICG
tara:strand:- start:3854 stop:4534 length:681 start_codon:yes stop_codon:yes gene_type:complete